MAALNPCGNCSCIYRRLSLYQSYQQFKSFSSAGSEIQEQRSRSKRDRLTVLKALSSTVKQVPNQPHYKLIDDSILNPRSYVKQNEILLAIESGEKAADFVLNKYPELFPLREPVPAWKDSTPIPKDVDSTVENLKLLMEQTQDVQRVIKMYEDIKQIGDVPASVHHQMLDFICFHETLPQKSTEEADQEESEESTPSYGDHLYDELKQTGDDFIQQTYILGLLKRGDTERAFDIFTKLNDTDFKSSLFLCNKMLLSIPQDDMNAWSSVELVTMHMNKAEVFPDQNTFNAILSAATHLADGNSLTQKVLHEMKKLGIESSLSSYYYILLAERKRVGYTDVNVLISVLEDLKRGHVKFEVNQKNDDQLFNEAMHMARYKRKRNLAEEIFHMVMSFQNYNLLIGGNGTQFFGNYLCVMTRDAGDADEIMFYYRKIVPEYTRPHDWVYQQMFLNLKSHKSPKFVPELYKDMVSMRVPMTEKVALPLFDVLSFVDNIPDEQVVECLTVAEDTMNWLEIFKTNVTQEIVSTSVKLLCLAGKTIEARELIDEYEVRGVRPNCSSLLMLLNANLKAKDANAATNTLKLMAKFEAYISRGELQRYLDNPLLKAQSTLIKTWFSENK